MNEQPKQPRKEVGFLMTPHTNDSPEGTGIAWAIQQINKHFNNLSGSDGIPVEDTLRPQSAKTVRRPGPSQKTLEEEFYRPGDFGIKVVATVNYSGGIDDEPKGFTVQAVDGEKL